MLAGRSRSVSAACLGKTMELDWPQGALGRVEFTVSWEGGGGLVCQPRKKSAENGKKINAIEVQNGKGTMKNAWNVSNLACSWCAAS